jgi:hypothetical protein
MGFAENFKNTGTKEILNKLKEKYNRQDVKKMSQNEILDILEQEKSQEKDEKMKGNYDFVIQAIKDFFAKKFNRDMAQKIIVEKAKDEQLSKKVMELINKNKGLEKFAKYILGDKFVEFVKKNNAYARKKNKDKNSAPTLTL